MAKSLDTLLYRFPYIACWKGFFYIWLYSFFLMVPQSCANCHLVNLIPLCIFLQGFKQRKFYPLLQISFKRMWFFDEQYGRAETTSTILYLSYWLTCCVVWGCEWLTLANPIHSIFCDYLNPICNYTNLQRFSSSHNIFNYSCMKYKKLF